MQSIFYTSTLPWVFSYLSHDTQSLAYILDTQDAFEMKMYIIFISKDILKIIQYSINLLTLINSLLFFAV